MVELNKIYQGMPLGAKAIDDNFNTINNEFVDKSTEQAINGDKTFSGTTTFKGPVVKPSKKVLWSGANWLSSDQTITPTKKISDCENGWILHFSEYKQGMNGNTKAALNHYNFVPKECLNLGDVGTTFPLATSTGKLTMKYLYIKNDSIGGTAANETSDAKLFVLQHVLEY